MIDLQGNEEGVIAAVGGMTGGFTMFIKDGRLYFDYNFLDGVYYTMNSPPLPTGTTELKFNFIETKEFGGTGEISSTARKSTRRICLRCTSAPIRWRRRST